MIKSFFLKTAKKLFGDSLDFRVRLFNIMAAAGILISLISGISFFFTGAGLASFIYCMLTMALSITLLWYSFVSGKYQLCYTITCFCIFLYLFPVMFFNAGGFHSGMPSFFIFAALFTVFMFEGKKMILMTLLELTVYTAICVYAYYNPEKINFFKSEYDVLIDIIISFVVVSLALGITMALHLRLYNRRQRELEAARKQVEEYAKIKSELFAGMSHEMRTPLTVMSAYAQFAVEQIRESSAAGKPGVNEQILADLATISDEAKRLAEMADGTLKILMTTFETDDSGGKKTCPIDISIISKRLVRLLEPVASRNGKKLSAVINGGIPEISGDMDAIAQLIWNLLQNAITHSEGKIIELTVEAINDDSGVMVTVRDDGIGIEPGILPHIFERGVRGKNGGSGIGLAICREIAQRHNGDITVKSNPGTSVTVQLRDLVFKEAVNV